MPVTPTYPGVYIEELPSRVRTVAAVSTSVTAFVGYTSRGPVNEAVTITSFADFERRFGGLAGASAVSYAVQQFFLNGGTVAVIVRVAKGAEHATAGIYSRADAGKKRVLTLRAREPGTWGNGLRVSVDHGTPTPDATFNLQLSHPSGQRESYADLSMDPDHERHVAVVVNGSSRLVTLTVDNDPEPTQRPDPVGTSSGKFPGAAPDPSGELEVSVLGGSTVHKLTLLKAGDPKPANLIELALLLENRLRTLPDTPGDRTYGAATVTVRGHRLQVVAGTADAGVVLKLEGAVGNNLGFGGGRNVTAYAFGGGENEGQAPGKAGEDGDLPGHTELIGNEGAKTGLYALRDVDDVGLLALPEAAALPGDTDLTRMVDVLGHAGRLCRTKRMFLLVDAPAAWSSVDAVRANLHRLGSVRSDHAALYFPRLHLLDPLSGRLRAFPPCGAVAGVMARTDAERGVWKAPAGTETRLNSVQGLTVPMTDPENGLLNPLAVNCVRSFPVIGPVVWGARTLDGADATPSQWKYVPVRRTALMIEESLYRGTKWVVFEPNDERLWAQIRLNVGAFMHSLFERGAFQGTSARDAYFVKCDKDTTTQNDINSGVVNVLVGFAPLKPAEFVIIKIEQLAGQIEV
ncbi:MULTISPECIES: phage tail sheath C-terminal domain-containing protein [unclassified Crossiella]|uniref:phage tail sheath family protein n=1 Tax=unclassified Crossiella TaxID=2620835 RepID=UPI0020004F9C|nr:MULTISPECIES: phage tail sheath C-terminal domain-containing protein [unclassified Crossiella]MCK2242397.1 phage tail sheath subtilisin-like domain-containing protein [Crossiella sp. S99.2]MCK2254572.1 phage tail sheath subtilisin-like domain-containing protein [Crossiella sp. S99.1]